MKTLNDEEQKKVYESLIRAQMLLENTKEFSYVRKVKKAMKNIEEVELILEQIKKIISD